MYWSGESVSEIWVFIAYVCSKDSDELAYLYSLTRSFPAHTFKVLNQVRLKSRHLAMNCACIFSRG